MRDFFFACIFDLLLLSSYPTEIGAADYHPLGMARVQKGTETIRIGQPEEISEIALFLASERSSLINGVALLADAGRSAW